VGKKKMTQERTRDKREFSWLLAKKTRIRGEGNEKTLGPTTNTVNPKTIPVKEVSDRGEITENEQS